MICMYTYYVMYSIQYTYQYTYTSIHSYSCVNIHIHVFNRNMLSHISVSYIHIHVYNIHKNVLDFTYSCNMLPSEIRQTKKTIVFDTYQRVGVSETMVFVENGSFCERVKVMVHLLGVSQTMGKRWHRGVRDRRNLCISSVTYLMFFKTMILSFCVFSLYVV